MPKIGIGQYPHEIARYYRRLKPTDWNVLAALGTDFRNDQKRTPGHNSYVEFGR